MDSEFPIVSPGEEELSRIVNRDFIRNRGRLQICTMCRRPNELQVHKEDGFFVLKTALFRLYILVGEGLKLEKRERLLSVLPEQ